MSYAGYYAPDPPKTGWAWEANWVIGDDMDIASAWRSAWRCPRMHQKVMVGVRPPVFKCPCESGEKVVD